MKQFQSGDDPRRNTKGRPKGSPNKSTDELRSMFRDFLSANMERLQSDFDQLEPKDRLLFIDRVARLILPPPMHELQTLTDEQLDHLIYKLKSEQNGQSKND